MKNNIVSLKKARAKVERKANKRTKNKHTFEVGNKPSRKAGRPPGSLNKFTVEVKDAVVNAAMNRGFDGKGTGGLIGYLEWAARVEPRSFLSLLARCIPINLVSRLDVDVAVLTPEQVVAKLRERGIDVERVFQMPKVVEVKAIDDGVKTVPVTTIEPDSSKPELTGIAPPRDTATKH